MPQPVVSLVARDRGGTAWACTPQCGPKQWGEGFYRDASRDGRIELKRIDGYDGEIFLGPITASPPATMR